MTLPQFKCRCSAISKIMSNSRSNPTLTEKQEVRLRELRERAEVGKLTVNQVTEMAELSTKEQNKHRVILSDTAVEVLTQWYALNVWGMVSVEKEAVSDIVQLKKGRLVENDSIALLSVHDGQIYEKWDDGKIWNDYLTGEPDIVHADPQNVPYKIIDIKSVWDSPGFLKKAYFGLDNGYQEQVQGYMDITGATEGEIAYCLVDMPDVIKADYKKKLFYAGDFVSEESPLFLEMWETLEKSMTFTDIPIEQRVHKIKIEPFTESERQRVYDRVKICRDWLAAFHESRQKLGKIELV